MDGLDKQNGSEDTGRESSAPIDFVLDEGCAGVSSARDGARKAETSHKDEEFSGRMESMADMWGTAYEDIENAIDILMPIESLKSDTEALDFLIECMGIGTKVNKKELELAASSAVYLCQTEGWPLPKASEFIYKYHQFGVLKEVYEAMLKTNAEEVESQFQHANNDFDSFGLGEFKDKKGNDYIAPGMSGQKNVETYLVQAFKIRLRGFHREGEPHFSNGSTKYVVISYGRLDESGSKHRGVAFWVGEVEKQSGDEVESMSESEREAREAIMEDIRRVSFEEYDPSPIDERRERLNDLNDRFGTRINESADKSLSDTEGTPREQLGRLVDGLKEEVDFITDNEEKMDYLELLGSEQFGELYKYMERYDAATDEDERAFVGHEIDMFLRNARRHLSDGE